MLKKRIVFTLLYDNGYFMLSRNFRLQKVGDLSWLQQHYNFSHIAFHIDELVVLDVSRNTRDSSRFCETLQELSRGCFAPIAAGGGVSSVSAARALLQSGADKVVVNSILFTSPSLVRELVEAFGQQCVVGSVDLKRNKDGVYRVYVENGGRELEGSAKDLLAPLSYGLIGEIYLNSIDRDGTGQGYDFELLSVLQGDWSAPVILAGGVGNSEHLKAGLEDSRVDAVATAHLFNFVGDGLAKARSKIVDSGVPLASWPPVESLAIPTQTCTA
jgi:imidazole glycerol-phosphate synthase subunit HisF